VTGRGRSIEASEKYNYFNNAYVIYTITQMLISTILTALLEKNFTNTLSNAITLIAIKINKNITAKANSAPFFDESKVK
jgi:hypothetical protein